jgi:F-type H+-transporting ATPase subunit O
MFSGRLAVKAARSSAPRVSIAGRTAFRSYAAPSAAQTSQTSSKPPIALFGIDGTYASALVCVDKRLGFNWMPWGSQLDGGSAG